MLIDIIAGTRPNFVKIAPICEAIEEKIGEGYDIHYRLIHTGQHYDKPMSELMFRQLGIREPDYNFHAGGGNQMEQTSLIMTRYDQLLRQERPELVIVVGDVTSTLACTLTAKRFHNIPVAHVEAGIRSGDWRMPEELNRVLTDALADYHFTPSRKASENLMNVGLPDDGIFFVGNTMIDTLLKHKDNLEVPEIYTDLGLEKGNYFVFTLHRQGNVDNEICLKTLIREVGKAARDTKIIFPVHPHTALMMHEYGVVPKNMHLTEPLGYLEFIYLIKNAKAVITDSGGISEETTMLNVPCLTLRDNTERPETCEIGTNKLLGTDGQFIKEAFEKVFKGDWPLGKAPELWDGQTAKRITDILCREFQFINKKNDKRKQAI